MSILVKLLKRKKLSISIGNVVRILSREELIEAEVIIDYVIDYAYIVNNKGEKRIKILSIYI